MDAADQLLRYVDLPWRVGGKIGRTIYAVTGEEPMQHPFIGVMDSKELAAAAVLAHNAIVEGPWPGP